ncbi:hypothetical protein C2E23DRAFT_148146 [Lenzites betulinus]|nr:hypothetical protein C2E23DRAFT_148146 [Lenzites betulinus]
MPVTEIAVLKLLSRHSWDSAETRSFFAAVASQQAAWSGYPLHYFQDTSDASVVYILTGWESVPAHWEWIKSEPNQKLLELGKGLIEVVGLNHVYFAPDLHGVDCVVLEQWEGERGEVRDCKEKAVVDVEGKVEENPEQAYGLRGFAAGMREEGWGGERVEGRTVYLRRLLVQAD